MATGEPQAVVELLAEFERNQALRNGQKLVFAGVGERDVYNITAPFRVGEERIIAGRVEVRDSELAELVFFVERDGMWRPRPDTQSYPKLQDPCVARIGAELVIGGVEFPVTLDSGREGWRMIFFRGKRLEDLERFLIGPDHMMDIRLVELADGRVGVFSRPQGEPGGRGTIGFTAVDSLEELNAEAIAAAPLLEGQFLEEEWGGANEAHLLADGCLGVLGHIARMDEEEKHYYPMAFVLDPANLERTPPRIIAARNYFPPGPPKRPDLVDIIFSGGLVRNGDGTATLYAGISDAEGARIDMPDPFVEYDISGANRPISRRSR